MKITGNNSSIVFTRPLALIGIVAFVAFAPQSANAQSQEVWHVISSPIQFVDFAGNGVVDGIFGSTAIVNSDGFAFGWAIAITRRGFLMAGYRRGCLLDQSTQEFALGGFALFTPFGGNTLDERELVIIVVPTQGADECLIWDLMSNGGDANSLPFLANGSIWRTR
ncbi:MAG: hypothetical protein ACR2NP_09825 [Pirellulaceae bacterium]